MNLLRVDFDFGDLATAETVHLLGQSLMVDFDFGDLSAAAETELGRTMTATFSFPMVGPTGPVGPPGPAATVIAWANITGRPATFSPSFHTHVAADVTDFATAVAAVSPPVDWNSLTGKPATFPPSGHIHPIAEVNGLQAALNAKQAAGDYATLVGGTVPSGQLPSYVDDVIEVANEAVRPATGEAGKIYITVNNNKVWRWSGSAYVEIVASPGSTDSVPEGSTNLYHTTSRAAAAAPVQSVAGRTGTITLAVADVSGAVSTSDSRLSDSRTPTAHTHELASLAATGTAADDILASDGDGTASWRTLSTFIGESVGPADIGAAAASHTHGNLTNGGAIGTTANLPVRTGTGGVLEAGAFGTSANTFCAGNDARLSDSRTPTAHAASHIAGRVAKYTGFGNNESFSEKVTITANTAGVAGNNITLTFDGVDDVDTALASWNAANPSNQATLIIGDGGQVPSDGDSLTLSGGLAIGNDPLANINQNLGNTDSPEFVGIYVGNGATGATNIGEATIMSGGGIALTMENPNGDQVSMRWFSPATSGTGNHWAFGCDTLNQNANNFFIWDFINNRPALWANGDNGNIVLGNEYAEGTLPAKVQVIGIDPSTATLLGLDNKTAGAIAMQIRAAASQSANLTEWLDSDDNVLASIDADGNISAPNFPTEVTDLAATGISANYVPVAQGDGTIVWEAQSGGGGGGEVRSDFVSPYTYTGLADAGTSESTASWTIRRSEYDSAGTHVATLTATSTSWNNRLTASYS